MSEIDLTAVRFRHMRASYGDHQICTADDLDWPCDARQLADALAAERTARASAEREGLRGLFREVAEWGATTFPKSTDHAKLTHLDKEVAELHAAPSSGEEMADVVMILCHLAYAHGVDMADEIRRKLAICRTRTWGEPDADGCVEHVREVPASPDRARLEPDDEADIPFAGPMSPPTSTEALAEQFRRREQDARLEPLRELLHKVDRVWSRQAEEAEEWDVICELRRWLANLDAAQGESA